MDLKNAVAVCLISLFSATLVMLIARSLDSQAASRLEPQLTRIAEELEVIRKQGGITTASAAGTAGPAADNALVVYYFHGVRCPTCRAAEANAHETLQAEYGAELDNGEVIWKVLDYMSDPMAQAMAIDFQVSDPTVVLARMKDGRIEAWNRLDRVLALATDKPALSAYLQEEIDAMLGMPDRAPRPTLAADVPAIPVPEDETDGIPVPAGPGEIPIPQQEP